MVEFSFIGGCFRVVCVFVFLVKCVEELLVLWDIKGKVVWLYFNGWGIWLVIGGILVKVVWVLGVWVMNGFDGVLTVGGWVFEVVFFVVV